ncbi:MAG TPA: phosphoribosylamine--glycine ligase [Candidatus Eisenbacteria bacterium]|jgi:phosphoribosylamine--glycine ligase
MTPVRVLVVGRGGREHVLAWRLAQDPEASEVLVAPGNDGMARSHRCIAVDESDSDGLIAACRSERIDLAVIGPEAPLAAGLADRLAAAGIAVYGPSADAARLESSKLFAKKNMLEAGIATAIGREFEQFEDAVAALSRFGPPWVLKVDGLAAGKGVLITRERKQAEEFLAACLLQDHFGVGGRRIVLEEFLEGEELSVMAVSDGARFTLLPAARDYKRALDGDQGPNTGGMGAYAPSPLLEPSLEDVVRGRVIAPILQRMEMLGTPFRGTLYAGLMLTPSGPMVLEFNGRFGDPESQAVLPLLHGSLTRLLLSAAQGALEPEVVQREPGAVVAVALVDEGYPDAVWAKGTIEGLEKLTGDPELMVFHAGTRWEEGRWQVRGGRAAYVVARAESSADARARVYRAIESLRGPGWRCRRDIAAPTGGVAAGSGLEARGGEGS